jgi:hypothetical protein
VPAIIAVVVIRRRMRASREPLPTLAASDDYVNLDIAVQE